MDFLTGLVPGNILGLQGSRATGDGLSFNVLQLIVIAVAVGVAALKAGEPAEPFLAFNRSALAIVQKVLWWVIRLAPIGTVGLIGNAVANYGWDLGSLGDFTARRLRRARARAVRRLPAAAARPHGLTPLRYFTGAWPAIQLAFVSRSSVGTMPVTQRVTERNLGVPRSYASFAVPLGATTKMDGCAAIYPALAAIFVAQFFGVDLGVNDYLLIAFVSVVGSAATAGLTGAMVMLTLTLSTLGLPLEGVGLLLAIDPILDMGRTAMNVAGQALVPTIVAKREGILDVERYRSTSPRRPAGAGRGDRGPGRRPAAARDRLSKLCHDPGPVLLAEGRGRRRHARQSSRSAQPDSSGSSGRRATTIGCPRGGPGGASVRRRSGSGQDGRCASPGGATQPPSTHRPPDRGQRGPGPRRPRGWPPARPPRSIHGRGDRRRPTPGS